MKEIKYLIFKVFFYTLVYGWVALLYFSIGKALYDLPQSVKTNETYMKYFDTEKYNELQKNEALKKQKILELRKKECAILVQAKRNIVPLKIEIYVLKGYEREKATRKATYDINESEIKCAKKGLSPYSDW